MNTVTSCRNLIVAFLIPAVALVAACGGNENGGKIGVEQAGDKEVRPDFSLTPQEFHAEFDKDSKAAAAKYKGKVVELSGRAIGICRNRKDGIGLYLEGGAKLAAVPCFSADSRPWTKATPGQTVKLRGKLPDFAVGARLVACVITNAEGPPASTLSAEALGKEYGADKNATTKKYEGKFLFLTGEVEKITVDEGQVRVVLKSAGKPRVFASFTGFAEKEAKDLKAGQKIKVLGEYFSRSLPPDEVGLSICLLVEEKK